jgi:hypothetical protein
MRYISLINWILVIICILSIFLLLSNSIVVENENGRETKFFRIQDNLDLSNTMPLSKVYMEALPNAIPALTLKDAKFVFFETFNRIDQMIYDMRQQFPKDCIINGMNGTDLLVSKSILAKYMKNSKYIPPDTFVLSDPLERKEFIDKVHANPSQIYILKKNIQRQEGMLIGSGNELLEEFEKGFIVAQKMLDDPFLVAGHKINLRFYLVVTIIDGAPKWLLYHNGFVYYTPKHYKENGIVNKDTIVTSGYVDRKIYEDNPLSLNELFEYLGESKSTTLMCNVYTCFRSLAERYTKVLRNANANIPGDKFTILGCDIAPNKDLDVTLMELNKGPDLSYKDERDKNVKLSLVKSLTQSLLESKELHLK